MLIAMAGLPGSGKSTLAARLAGALKGQVLDKDRVRTCLFRPEDVEYSREQDDFCMDVLYRTAAFLLRRDAGRSVLIDGRPFAYPDQVEALAQFARREKLALKWIECVCSDETARQRLEACGAQADHPAANRSYALYLALKAVREPLPEPKCIVNTERGLEECLQRCLEYLRFE